MSKYKRYMELRTGGPYGPDHFPEQEIFKCSKCNSETAPEKGFDGEPNTHVCSHDCRMDHGDLQVGNSSTFVRNHQKIAWKGEGTKERLARLGIKVIEHGA